MLTNIIWLGGLGLQACLLGLLFKRGAHYRFRVFFFYTLVSVIGGTTRFILRKHAILFFYFSWSAEAAYAVLALAALYEAYYRLFGHASYRPGIRYAFPTTAIIALALAGLWLWLHGPLAHGIPLVGVIFAVEFAVALVQFAFFALIIFLALVRSDSTRRYGYGIALGFGIAAFGTFADAVIFSEFGTKYRDLLELVSPVAYVVAVVFWLSAFARPEPRVRIAGPEPDPREVLDRVRQLRKDAEEHFGAWLDLSSFRSGSGSP